MLLLETVFKDHDQCRVFKFEGDVEVVKDRFGTTLEFDHLIIYEKAENGKVVFKPTTVTWTGKKLDEEDAITDVIARLVRNEQGDFETVYVCEEILSYVKSFTKEIALDAYSRSIPLKVTYGSMLTEYYLCLVTDKFTYYVCEDSEVLMLETKTGEVVSDNYFASVGYEESCENITAGTETAYWMYELQEKEA